MSVAFVRQVACIAARVSSVVWYGDYKGSEEGADLVRCPACGLRG